MKPTQRLALWSSNLAGTSLPVRLRRLTFAMFGLTASIGLALVAIAAQTDYRISSFGPLPIPAPAAIAPGESGDPGSGSGLAPGEGGSFGGLAGPSGPAGAAPGANIFASGSDQEEDSVFVAVTPQPGSIDDSTGEDAPGLEGEVSGVAGITAAQSPTVPPVTAAPSSPVSGSNGASGLFVRSAVAPGLGEEGDVDTSVPVPPEEPEEPVEPETPVEPPVEPEEPVEPEVPTDPVLPEEASEPGAEETPVEPEALPAPDSQPGQ